MSDDQDPDVKCDVYAKRMDDDIGRTKLGKTRKVFYLPSQQAPIGGCGLYLRPEIADKYGEKACTCHRDRAAALTLSRMHTTYTFAIQLKRYDASDASDASRCF